MIKYSRDYEKDSCDECKDIEERDCTQNAR